MFLRSDGGYASWELHESTVVFENCVSTVVSNIGFSDDLAIESEVIIAYYN